MVRKFALRLGLFALPVAVGMAALIAFGVYVGDARALDQIVAAQLADPALL